MSFIQELFTSRNNGANGADFIGKQGRIWWDPVTNCLYYSDGVTPGGIPIGQGEVQPYGEFTTETFIATASQDTFELLHAPSGHVTGSINGATMAADALVETGVTIQYRPDLNDGYVLRAGDEITFSYLYGTVRASTIGDLGDVHLGNVQGGQVLVYDGRLNMWVAGNPNGALQNGIQNGTTVVRILDADGSVKYKISGIAEKIVMSTTGIDILDGGYSVNGNLAVNGPTLQIENKNSTDVYDACDRPITVPYNQSIESTVPTTVEFSRLCWDTVNRFNPTANPITIASKVIEPWSWRPLIPGYYSATVRATLDRDLLPSTAISTGLTSHQYTATLGQTVFNIQSLPKGDVIFVINGATVPADAVSVTLKTVSYLPVNNDGYIIKSGDEISIVYVTGGADPGIQMKSESGLAALAQTEFTLPDAATGILMASLNGATLQTSAFIINDNIAEYVKDANDGYTLQSGDVITICYLTGTSGNKVLINESYYSAINQAVFQLTGYPSGTVIASLNGAVLPPEATRIVGKSAIYLSSGNNDYVLRSGDVVTYTYIGENTDPSISTEYATISIVVNGVIAATGCKSTWINNTIDVEVDTILKLTDADNVSVSIFQNSDGDLPVKSATLSSSMVRGI